MQVLICSDRSRKTGSLATHGRANPEPSKLPGLRLCQNRLGFQYEELTIEGFGVWAPSDLVRRLPRGRRNPSCAPGAPEPLRRRRLSPRAAPPGSGATTAEADRF